MAITYPLTAPVSTIGPENITLRVVTADTISGSPFTYKQQVISLGGTRWEMSVSIPPLNRATAEVWVSFLLSLKGRTGTFTMGDPMAVNSMGVYGGSLALYKSLSLDFTNGVYSKTDKAFQASVDGSGQYGDTLNIKGLPISTVGVLKAGDYIQINSGAGQTLHKVLLTVDSNVDGKASLDIYPPLRSVSVDNTPCYFNATKGVFRLKDNTVEWSMDNALKYGISFDAVEALI